MLATEMRTGRQNQVRKNMKKKRRRLWKWILFLVILAIVQGAVYIASHDPDTVAPDNFAERKRGRPQSA